MLALCKPSHYCPVIDRNHGLSSTVKTPHESGLHHLLHPQVFSTHDRRTESLVWSATKTLLEMDMFDDVNTVNTVNTVASLAVIMLVAKADIERVTTSRGLQRGV
jgi:hypothetical protein